MSFIPKTDHEVAEYMLSKEKMIYSLVHKYDTCRIDWDDRVQEARCGFLKGIRSYKEGTTTASLDTYCYRCAENQIKMLCRASFAQKRGGGETKMVSLNDVLHPNSEKGRGCLLESMIADEQSEESQQDIYRKDIFECIIKLARECLTDREFNILMLYYQDNTQLDISRRYNVSQSTAGRTIRLSHAKLRWYLEQNGYKSYADVI